MQRQYKKQLFFTSSFNQHLMNAFYTLGTGIAQVRKMISIFKEVCILILFDSHTNKYLHQSVIETLMETRAGYTQGPDRQYGEVSTKHYLQPWALQTPGFTSLYASQMHLFPLVPYILEPGMWVSSQLFIATYTPLPLFFSFKKHKNIHV